MISMDLMTKEQYESFFKRIIPDYVAGTMIALRLSQEEATTFAQNQINEVLKEGQATPNNFFYAISDRETKEQVGHLWLFLKEKNNEKNLFIADIYIDEQCRGKNIGTQTLEWIDLKAKELGCALVSLHVFGHNQRAFKLYEKMGFSPFSIQMRKVL